MGCRFALRGRGMIETGATYKSPRSSARAALLESWRHNDGERLWIERARLPSARLTSRPDMDYRL